MKNWSYLAAMFDGEGTIALSKFERLHDKDCKNSYWQCQLIVSIANTDFRLMKWLISNFGGVYYSSESKNPNAKLKYTWRPKGRKNTENVLLGILPNLLLKNAQAKLAIEYLRLNPHGDHQRRLELVEACKPLNRRGKSVETNTLTSEEEMIESGLIGNNESALVVTQDA
jgi:hypothetical protein